MPDQDDDVRVTAAVIAHRFYAALNAHDQDAIGTLVDEWFDPAAVAELPPSLPYGGRIESARRLRRMFQNMAAGAPFGPASVDVRSVVDGGDQAAVQLTVDWRPPGGGAPVVSGALELWSLVDGRVREIRAYYWDTAALAAVTPA